MASAPVPVIVHPVKATARIAAATKEAVLAAVVRATFLVTPSRVTLALPAVVQAP